MALSGLCLFITVPWVGLQCSIEAFPGCSNYLLVNKLNIARIDLGKEVIML